MYTVLVQIRIKPEVDGKAYEDWARETVRPTVLKEFKSVQDWRLWRAVDPTNSGSRPPFDYVVLITTDDLKQLNTDLTSPIGSALAGRLRTDFAESVLATTSEQAV